MKFSTSPNISGEGFLLSIYATSTTENTNVDVKIDGSHYCYVVTGGNAKNGSINCLISNNQTLGMNVIKGEFSINFIKENDSYKNPLEATNNDTYYSGDNYLFLTMIPFKKSLSLTNSTSCKIIYFEKIA